MNNIQNRFLNAFPNITNSNFIPTSPSTETYNCIAWAYGINHIPMWPDPLNVMLGIYFWPEDLPCNNTLESFITLFFLIGYTHCLKTEHEIGYEKIAIYTKNGIPTHAARQIPNGKWTSKLGSDIDIQHDTLDCLNGPSYGKVEIIMRRKIKLYR